MRCPSAWVSGIPWVGPAFLCRIGQWIGLERATSLQVTVNRAPRLVRTADFRDFGSVCSRQDWRFRPEVKVTGKRRRVQNHQFRQSIQALRAGDKSRRVCLNLFRFCAYCVLKIPPYFLGQMDGNSAGYLAHEASEGKPRRLLFFAAGPVHGSKWPPHPRDLRLVGIAPLTVA
jgi:hypothetical protein